MSISYLGLPREQWVTINKRESDLFPYAMQNYVLAFLETSDVSRLASTAKTFRNVKDEQVVFCNRKALMAFKLVQKKFLHSFFQNYLSSEVVGIPDNATRQNAQEMSQKNIVILMQNVQSAEPLKVIIKWLSSTKLYFERPYIAELLVSSSCERIQQIFTSSNLPGHISEKDEAMAYEIALIIEPLFISLSDQFLIFGCHPCRQQRTPPFRRIVSIFDNALINRFNAYTNQVHPLLQSIRAAHSLFKVMIAENILNVYPQLLNLNDAGLRAIQVSLENDKIKEAFQFTETMFDSFLANHTKLTVLNPWILNRISALFGQDEFMQAFDIAQYYSGERSALFQSFHPLPSEKITEEILYSLLNLTAVNTSELFKDEFIATLFQVFLLPHGFNTQKRCDRGFHTILYTGSLKCRRKLLTQLITSLSHPHSVDYSSKIYQIILLEIKKAFIVPSKDTCLELLKIIDLIPDQQTATKAISLLYRSLPWNVEGEITNTLRREILSACERKGIPVKEISASLPEITYDLCTIS